MTLSSLIRKRDTGNLATAIPAISATQPKGEAATVARIATVAVANPKEWQTDHAVDVLKIPPNSPSTAMTAEEMQAIRAWLALIEETDPATIAEVIGQCQRDADARDYFTGRAANELLKPDPFPDDRRCCSQCLNLRGRVCTIAKPGGLVSANLGYRPAAGTLQRCAGYLPNATDTDQQTGGERWPGI